MRPKAIIEWMEGGRISSASESVPPLVLSARVRMSAQSVVMPTMINTLLATNTDPVRTHTLRFTAVSLNADIPILSTSTAT